MTARGTWDKRVNLTLSPGLYHTVAPVLTSPLAVGNK